MAENTGLLQHYAFIGAGNMAEAILRGLVKAGVPATHIVASNPSTDKLQRLENELGIRTTTDNIEAATTADCVLLCVKPQKMNEVLDELGRQPLQGALVISVAAGYRLDGIRQRLSGQRGVVRVMPNTPALIGEGASALYAGDDVAPADRQWVSDIFAAVGRSVWLDSETQMDIATAIAGSSPAYLFAMAEAMVEAAVELGLPEHKARELSLQALRGAAMLAQSDQRSLSQLRQAVTSPGGTTEAALRQMQSLGFHAAIKAAVKAAFSRGQALAESSQPNSEEN